MQQQQQPGNSVRSGWIQVLRPVIRHVFSSHPHSRPSLSSCSTRLSVGLIQGRRTVLHGGGKKGNTCPPILVPGPWASGSSSKDATVHSRWLSGGPCFLQKQALQPRGGDRLDCSCPTLDGVSRPEYGGPPRKWGAVCRRGIEIGAGHKIRGAPHRKVGALGEKREGAVGQTPPCHPATAAGEFVTALPVFGVSPLGLFLLCTHF